MIASVAAFGAWLGVSLVVLADGRRGLAAGLGLATIAVSILAWQSRGAIAAAILLFAGATATVQRLRVGSSGWAVMPAGSTPRVILCVGVALLSLWIAATLTTGSGAALRFAVLTTLGLAGARLLVSDDSAALMTAVAALALGLAIAPVLDAGSGGITQVIAAGLLVAGSAWLSRTRQHAG